MSKIPVTLQMYTLRDDAAADLEGTLAAVKAIGYAGVELAGYAGKTAAEYKQLLDANGLSAVGAHVGFDQAIGDAAQAIDEAKLFGLTYVVVPWVGSPYADSLDGFRELGAKLTEASAAYAAAGLKLGYHNHAFEFAKVEDGVNGFDALFGAAGPHVVIEMDTFWVKKGGQDPVAYLGKYAGRVPLVHLKDMDADGDFAPVGAGTIDYGALIPAARAAGAEYFIVEQDSCKSASPLESVRISFENLKAWGVA